MSCVKLSLNFSERFKSNLLSLADDISTEISQINDHLTTKSTKMSSSHFSLELNDYLRAFNVLVHKISSLCDAINGSKQIDSENLLFYSLINFEEANFFDLIRSKLANSTNLREFLSNGVQMRINPALFYNPKRVLTSIVYDKFHKLSQQTSKVFALEVIDESGGWEKYVGDEDYIVLENVCLVNAYYEIMSKSFQPMLNKGENRIRLVRLKPWLEESGGGGGDGGVKQISGEERSFKYVPLIDVESKEIICYLCVKFWQSNQSSLSSTWNKEEEVVEVANKPTIASNNNNNNIPFYAPIYFYFFNNSIEHYLV